MSLLTELEILGDVFLQRCRAYGAGGNISLRFTDRFLLRGLIGELNRASQENWEI